MPFTRVDFDHPMPCIRRPSSWLIVCLAAVMSCSAWAEWTLAQCAPFLAANSGGETTAVAPLSSNALYVAHGRTLDLINGSTTSPSTFLHYFNQSGTRLTLPTTARKISRLGPGYAHVLLDDGKVLCITGSTATTTAVATISSGSLGMSDIQADGTRVFATDGNSLFLYDLSSGLPVWQSGIGPVASGYIMRKIVKVSGSNIVWVAIYLPNSSIYGVSAYDFTNPTSPVLISTLLDSIPITDETGIDALAINSGATSLFVGYQGRSMTNGPYHTWIRGVSIADPYHPTWNLGFDTGYKTHDISITGTQLHIASNDYLQIWETANPNALSEVGYYHIQGGIGYRVFAGSGVLAGKSFIAAGEAGLIVVNTTTPSSNMPVLGTAALLPWHPLLVRQAGATTAVRDDGGVLRLFDYSQPEAQQAQGVASVGTASSPLMEICTIPTGPLACMAADEGDHSVVHIMNIANPGVPTQTGQITLTSTKIRLMSGNGRRLYLFDTAKALQVFDLQIPAAPAFVGFYYVGPPSTNPDEYVSLVSWSVAGSERVAVAHKNTGIWFIDATANGNPVLVRNWHPHPAAAIGSMVLGPTFLYVSALIYSYPPIIDTVNVADISLPFRVYERTYGYAGYSGPFTSMAYVSAGSQAFLIGANERQDPWLRCFDASIQSDPVSIAEMKFPHFTGQMAPVPGSTNIRAACGLGGIDEVAMPTQWAPAARYYATPVSICRGGTAVLSLPPNAVSASPAPTYQWRRNNVSLVNGPTAWGSVLSGVTTTTLQVASARLTDKNSYECVVTNTCGEDAVLGASIQMCASDFNCDGQRTVSDIFAFLSAWFAHAPLADINDDGHIDVADIFAFLSAWFASC